MNKTNNIDYLFTRNSRFVSRTRHVGNTWCSWAALCWPTSWRIRTSSGCSSLSMRRKVCVAWTNWCGHLPRPTMTFPPHKLTKLNRHGDTAAEEHLTRLVWGHGGRRRHLPSVVSPCVHVNQQIIIPIHCWCETIHTRSRC